MAENVSMKGRKVNVKVGGTIVRFGDKIVGIRLDGSKQTNFFHYVVIL